MYQYRVIIFSSMAQLHCLPQRSLFMLWNEGCSHENRVSYQTFTIDHFIAQLDKFFWTHSRYKAEAMCAHIFCVLCHWAFSLKWQGWKTDRLSITKWLYINRCMNKLMTKFYWTFALLGTKNMRIPDALDSPVQIDPLITKQILEYKYR